MTFYESPKYYLAIGEDAKAIDVIHKMAAFNKQPTPDLNMKMFEELADRFDNTPEGSHITLEQHLTFVQRARKAWNKGVAVRFRHLKAVFADRQQALTLVLLCIVFMGDTMAFTLAGAVRPPSGHYLRKQLICL